MKKIQIALLPLLLLIATAHSRAGDIDTGKEISTTAPEVIPFRAGGYEVELRDGAFASILNDGVRKPKLDYQIASISFGWMLNNVKYSGLFRGNNEFLLEAFGADTFQGPGHFMTGSEAMWRYNFVQPGAKLIPYFELGGGGLYNDIYHHQVQRLIGEGFEFMLHSGAGVRWMINDHWALSIEGDYRHVSNAGLSSRNQGLNSLGGSLGLNWFF